MNKKLKSANLLILLSLIPLLSGPSAHSANKLIRAIKGNDPALAISLIQKKPRFWERRNNYYKLSKKQFNGATALILASQKGMIDVVRALLAADPSPVHSRFVDHSGYTALIWAVHYGNNEVVQALIDHDPAPEHLHYQEPNFGETALMIAAAQGNASILSALIEKDPSLSHLNLISFKKSSALRYAIDQNKAECQLLLVAKGASLEDLNLNEMGLTIYPMSYFVRKFSASALISVLGKNTLEQYIKQPDNEGHTALIWAVYTNKLDFLKILLDLDPSREHIEHQNFHGNNALNMAASHGNLEAAQILIERDSHPLHFKAPNKNGFTPLLTAANKGNLKLSEYFLFLEGLSFSITDNLHVQHALETAISMQQSGLTALIYLFQKIMNSTDFAELERLGTEFNQFKEQNKNNFPLLNQVYLIRFHNADLRRQEAELINSRQFQQECSLCKTTQMSPRALGPAHCFCFICPECKPSLVAQEIENTEMPSQCPGCQDLIHSKYLVDAGVGLLEITRFLEKQLKLTQDQDQSPSPTLEFESQ